VADVQELAGLPAAHAEVRVVEEQDCHARGREAVSVGWDLRPWPAVRRLPSMEDMRRTGQLRAQLADARGGRVVFLSHCLLNENVRYLGGAGRAGGVGEVAGRYLDAGVGICQMPCPEQRAWGGVLKRRMLLAYGSGGTFRAPLARLMLRPFTRYTRGVYARLARALARDIVDYRRSGIEVAGLVGIDGSPSCGVHTTLDLPAAVAALTRCPAAGLDRRTLNEDIIAANVRPGEGMFIAALRRRLARAGINVPVRAHDLLAELGIQPAPVDQVTNGLSGIINLRHPNWPLSRMTPS
jgi:predicted secreted protein